MDKTKQAAELLAWYDRHARKMPWRVPPGSGRTADPYHVWLSEVMLQQTTVAAVEAYFTKFVALWPTVTALAAADDDAVMAAWAGLGYYARARNLLKCARAVAGELNGIFPNTEEDLRKLPGIGPYTAAAVASIAFGRSATVLDGNVERVMARIYQVADPLPEAKPLLYRHAAELTPNQRPGDYAQAVMDLGATVCTPKSPACGLCPWMAYCAGRMSAPQDYPRKRPKPPKPTRYGTVFVVQRSDGAVLLERRPGKGLLGGMLGWPGGPWAEDPPDAAAPLDLQWTVLPATVRHTFTHFHLELTVQVARTRRAGRPRTGRFMPLTQFEPGDLPTVMRKVWRLATPSLSRNS